MSDLISREAAIETLRVVIAAWEHLSGGQHSRKDVERWLADIMKPAIDAARKAVAEQDIVDRSVCSSVKVKPLVWVESHIKPWNNDWHTNGTGYTIRCGDEWGWKWSNGVGGHGYESSPASSKAAAQADYESRILAALEGGDV